MSTLLACHKLLSYTIRTCLLDLCMRKYTAMSNLPRFTSFASLTPSRHCPPAICFASPVLLDLCCSHGIEGCITTSLFCCCQSCSEMVMVKTRKVDQNLDLRFVPCRCTSSDSLRNFRLTTTVYDITWDLFAFAGYSTASELGGGAIVVAFRGTDSHSLYNWVENMRYWKTDYDIPYPGSEGALVHTGDSSKAVTNSPLSSSNPPCTCW